jgi:hypothetical protein
MPNTPVSAPGDAANPRNIWMRALLMLMMALFFQIAGTLLCLLAVVQFVLSLVNDRPNDRLRALARGLGQYLGQIAQFVGYTTEELPFPFSDWPPGAP